MMSKKFTVGNTYCNTCWFTGGTTTYVCISRTDSEVSFTPTYHELDGIHKGTTETFHLCSDDTGEYVVAQTYKGEENCMYA